MSRMRLALAFFFLAALTFGPLPGLAAPKPVRPTAVIPSEQPGLVASFLGFIRHVAEKTGCAVDPLGRCIPTTNSQPEPICPGEDPATCQDWR